MGLFSYRGAGRTEMNALEIANASFGYGAEAALTGINFELKVGESLALIGPNGSGKSTLLKGILGFAALTEGAIRVLGQSPKKARALCGYLPQANTRDTDVPVTTRQVVTMGLFAELGAFKPLGAKTKIRVEQALFRVGLTEQAGELFSELSGGQQQRAILARALVSDPKLVLLDEPFNGLDQPNRDELLETIKTLRSSGTSVVVSTHDLDLAREVCSHVLLLNKKQIGFGEVNKVLTLDLITETFAGATVELDHHTVTTTDELE